jgi:aryl-alcohol dehydrogenase
VPTPVGCLSHPSQQSPGHTIRGIIEDDSVPDVFIPRLVELHQRGRLRFDRLVRFYELDEINRAAEDAEEGSTVKPVLRVGV